LKFVYLVSPLRVNYNGNIRNAGIIKPKILEQVQAAYANERERTVYIADNEKDEGMER
jgi:hypothetical protein